MKGVYKEVRGLSGLTEREQKSRPYSRGPLMKFTIAMIFMDFFSI